MLKLIKQNLRFTALYLATVLVVIVALKFITGGALSPPFVILSGFLAYMLAFGIIYVIEQYEEKHHGYVFLSTLPINVREIVFSKFLRVLIAEIIFIGAAILLLSFSSASTDQLVVAHSWILLNGLIALVLGALALIGLFSTSYTTFLKISMVLLVFLQMIPLLLMSSGKMQTFIEGTTKFLSTVNWLIWIPVGLLVYFGLMVAAIKVKTLRRC